MASLRTAIRLSLAESLEQRKTAGKKRSRENGLRALPDDVLVIIMLSLNDTEIGIFSTCSSFSRRLVYNYSRPTLRRRAGFETTVTPTPCSSMLRAFELGFFVERVSYDTAVDISYVESQNFLAGNDPRQQWRHGHNERCKFCGGEEEPMIPCTTCNMVYHAHCGEGSVALSETSNPPQILLCSKCRVERAVCGPVFGSPCVLRAPYSPNKVLITGDYHSRSFTLCSDVYEYDLETKIWTLYSATGNKPVNGFGYGISLAISPTYHVGHGSDAASICTPILLAFSATVSCDNAWATALGELYVLQVSVNMAREGISTTRACDPQFRWDKLKVFNDYPGTRGTEDPFQQVERSIVQAVSSGDLESSQSNSVTARKQISNTKIGKSDYGCACGPPKSQHFSPVNRKAFALTLGSKKCATLSLLLHGGIYRNRSYLSDVWMLEFPSVLPMSSFQGSAGLPTGHRINESSNALTINSNSSGSTGNDGRTMDFLNSNFDQDAGLRWTLLRQIAICDEFPGPRAGHSLTRIGRFYYLFGGLGKLEKVKARDRQSRGDRYMNDVFRMEIHRYQELSESKTADVCTSATCECRTDQTEQLARVNFIPKPKSVSGPSSSTWFECAWSCLEPRGSQRAMVPTGTAAATVLAGSNTNTKKIPEFIQGPKPPARACHSAISVGVNLIIAGGQGASAVVFGDIWLLDTIGLSWSSPCVAFPLSYPPSYQVNSRLIAGADIFSPRMSPSLLYLPSRTARARRNFTFDITSCNSEISAAANTIASRIDLEDGSTSRLDHRTVDLNGTSSILVFGGASTFRPTVRYSASTSGDRRRFTRSSGYRGTDLLGDITLLNLVYNASACSEPEPRS